MADAPKQSFWQHLIKTFLSLWPLFLLMIFFAFIVLIGDVIPMLFSSDPSPAIKTGRMLTDQEVDAICANRAQSTCHCETATEDEILEEELFESQDQMGLYQKCFFDCVVSQTNACASDCEEKAQDPVPDE